MSLAQTVADIRRHGDWSRLPQAIPFARMLKLRVDVRGESFTSVLPYEPSLIGNPLVPALHGGAIGGFLECAGILHMLWSTDAPSIPKTINFSIDYLLSCRPQDTYANVYMVKLGKRVSNLRIEAWQTTPDKPVVVATLNLLMR
ncbi:PaaI family thioesterase [Nevskia sp.]|uniref:PaaI family thioesterase n=1 Tax=Nevskia sp. TaxID=1929292 RepID=UPI0025D5938D|nr:PaaI family thioesterase [Nevskia sp.]